MCKKNLTNYFMKTTLSRVKFGGVEFGDIQVTFAFLAMVRVFPEATAKAAVVAIKCTSHVVGLVITEIVFYFTDLLKRALSIIRHNLILVGVRMALAIPAKCWNCCAINGTTIIAIIVANRDVGIVIAKSITLMKDLNLMSFIQKIWIYQIFQTVL